MNARTDRLTFLMFSVLVALLVALGAQMLLDQLVLASLGGVHGAVSGARTRSGADVESLWIASTVIRLLSFAMGGWVSVRLVGGLNRRLLALLLLMAILATVFEPFPGRMQGLMALVLWSLSALVGVSAGAWSAWRWY